MAEIDISGLPKAKLLVALFDSAQPSRLLPTTMVKKDLSLREAQRVIDSGQKIISNLQGKVLNLNISGNKLDTNGYDREHGQGAAARIVMQVKKDNQGAATEPVVNQINARRGKAGPAAPKSTP